jgi:two-component system chemotaxis response regulator CheY
MQVVLLDDSLTMLNMLSAYLDELGVDSCDIFATDDGAEALEFIEDSDGVDLIISDLHMPKMDGEVFIEKVITFDEALQKKIYVISGVDDIKRVDDIKDIGIKKFLRKPINFDTFKHFIGREIEIFNRSI